MGQCSSSLRQSLRHSQHYEEQSQNNSHVADASNMTGIRRKRSANGTTPVFKRPCPQDDPNGNGELAAFSSHAQEDDISLISELTESGELQHTVSPPIQQQTSEEPHIECGPSSSSLTPALLPENVDEGTGLGTALSTNYFSNPNSPYSSPSSDEENEFFDAPDTLPDAGNRIENLRRSDASIEIPSSLPPPPPTSSDHDPLDNANRRIEEEEEQVTVLSRVLLAAATLTAMHLVGEQFSRGEQYSVLNQVNNMQRQQEIETRLREQMRQTDDNNSSFSGSNSSESPMNTNNTYDNTDTHDAHEIYSVDAVSADAAGNTEDSEWQDTARPLSFPDFLEQLRSGTLSSELSQVMFTQGRATNFFRFFRFPEDREGRVPILLMGIRSAQGNQTATEEEERSAGDLAEPGNMRNTRPISTTSENSDIASDAMSERLNIRDFRVDLPSDTIGSQFTESYTREEHIPFTSDNDRQGIFGHHLTPQNSGEHTDVDDTNEDLALAGSEQSSRDIHDTESVPTNQGIHDTGSDSFMDALLDGIAGQAFPSPNSNSEQQHSVPFLNTTSEAQEFNDTNFDHNLPREENENGSSIAGSGNRPRRYNHSWVIYVIGGAYPTTHPIFSTPSLFAESPTYEDMLFLEQLLGPVKPPVASKDDVNSAGGTFIVEVGSHLLNERCSICLTDYAEEDICRRLGCAHIFHKECVDSWLTRSHNSCPMCRHEGVPAHFGPNNSRPQPMPNAFTF